MLILQFFEEFVRNFLPYSPRFYAHLSAQSWNISENQIRYEWNSFNFKIGTNAKFLMHLEYMRCMF